MGFWSSSWSAMHAVHTKASQAIQETKTQTLRGMSLNFFIARDTSLEQAFMHVAAIDCTPDQQLMLFYNTNIDQERNMCLIFAFSALLLDLHSVVKAFSPDLISFACSWIMNGVRRMKADPHLRKAHYRCNKEWFCKCTLQIVYDVRDPTKATRVVVGDHKHVR